MRTLTSRTFLTLLIAVSMTTALPTVAAAAMTRTTTKVSADGVQWGSPQVSGDIVAWLERPAGGEWSVRVRNVSTGASWTPDAWGVTGADLAVGDGRYVSWADTLPPNFYHQRVGVFDTVSGETTMIAGGPAGPSYDSPAIDDGRLVFWNSAYGNAANMRWMSTPLPVSAPASEIATSLGGGDPALHGSTLSYVDSTDAPGILRVWTRDLDTGERHLVTEEATHVHGSTDISDDLVVWEDGAGPGARTHIGWYDRVSGERGWFSGGSGWEGQAPSTSRAKTVWFANKYGPYDVFSYDSYRGVEATVTGNGSGQDSSYPDVDGKRVVYVHGDASVPASSGVYLTEWTCASERISASDRFGVAVASARKAYPMWSGVNHVVVASGLDAAAADPLAAGGLCWAYDAPLLLVAPTSVPNAVKTALREIKAANPSVIVHVVGGTGSVPNTRLADMRAIVGAGQVERVLGTGTRYDMAKVIALRMKAVRPAEMTGCKVFVCNGADPTRFMEALAASAISRGKGYPVLLVSKTSAPTATKQALAALAPTARYVVGNTASVSDAVAGQCGVAPGDRWGAGSIAGTLKVVAENAVANRYADPSAIAIAAKLPDALSAGCLVGRSGVGDSRGGVILLTGTSAFTSTSATYLGEVKADVSQCWVMGGTGSITSVVQTAVDARLH